MSGNIEITAAIRDTRKAKALSQNELSARIGVPQSHISKIESGAVDIKLSSLVQIARALDLEVELVPRKSLPAVESIVRATRGFPRDRTGPALSEIKKLERLLDSVNDTLLSARLSPSLESIDKSLQGLKTIRYDTDAFVRLRKALGQISKIIETLETKTLADRTNPSPPAKEIKSLNRAADELNRVRNSLAHRVDTADKGHRPAYGFERDDDD